MMRYSVRPRDQILLKGCGFLSFTKYMSINIDEYISKKLSNKYIQKLLDHAYEISATDALKTVSKRAIHKTVETVSDLIGNKIADKIAIISIISPHNSSATVRNETEKIKHDK